MYRSTILIMLMLMAFMVEVLAKSSAYVFLYRGKIGIALLLAALIITIFTGRRPTRALVVFVFLTIISGTLGIRSYTDSLGAYQFFLNLKFCIAVIVANGLISESTTEKKLPILFIVILLVSTLFIVIEKYFPAIYVQIFPQSVIDTYIFGTEYVRFTGCFTDASSYGSFCIATIIFFYSFGRYTSWKWAASLGLCLSVYGLFMSGQRMEAVSGVFAILVFLVLEYRKSAAKIATVILACAALIFLVKSPVAEYGKKISSWEDITVDWTGTDPRLALLSGAVYLAKINFPMGAGLGRYGSSMSLSGSEDTYMASGVDRLWWYKQDDSPYLTDSYWAMVIGELGFIGFFVAIFSQAYLLVIAARKYVASKNKKDQFYARAAFIAISYCIINSFASNIYLGSLAFMLPQAIMYSLLFLRKNNN